MNKERENEEMLSKLNLSILPNHVAIIMDGNGRWAKEHNKERLFGHKQGVNSVKNISEACGELGISYLTLYAFSTENWNRPKQEVDGLMQLLVSTLSNEIESLNKNQTALKVIGDLESLPKNCIEELHRAMDLTKHNKRLTLILALSYSSRWEINKAVKNIIEDTEKGKISSSNFDEKLFESYLTTYDTPDPELLIRTSGEHRISNFLLYQIAYSELYFASEHWPDFNKESFYKALYHYQNRERRFGKISEQL